MGADFGRCRPGDVSDVSVSVMSLLRPRLWTDFLVAVSFDNAMLASESSPLPSAYGSPTAGFAMTPDAAYKEALKRIETARTDKLPILDFGDLPIAQLPPALVRLGD